MSSRQTARLFRLSESDYTVADPAEDVRGRSVLDSQGEEVGSVDDLLIDESEKKVRYLRLESGGVLGIGEKSFLLPIDAITRIDEENVHVDATGERMASGPEYDPELAYDEDHLAYVSRYYGYMPYGTAGYAYPLFPYYP